MSDCLADLVQTCEDLKSLQQELTVQEKHVADLKEKIRSLSEDVIPSMMDEIGLSSIQLNDGSSVSYKPEINISINKQYAMEALAWLSDNKYGDLIKSKIQVNFAREKRDEALAEYAALIDKGLDAVIDESIHPMTLKAWAKERMKNGGDIPCEFFNLYHYNKTIIGKPKV